MLGCSILWFVAPAAVTAWRSADVSGIAWQTWALLALDGLVFGLYGLVSGIGADRVYGSAALVGSAVILAGLAMGSRQSAPALVLRSAWIVRMLDDNLPMQSLRARPDERRPLPVFA